MEKSKISWTVDLDSATADAVEDARRKAALAESKTDVLERLILQGLTALELESAHKQEKESHHV